MIVSPDQMPAKWSEIAPQYEQAFEPLSRQFASQLFGLMALRPGERVIDVAAGTGAFSLLAAAAGCEVLATDFAPAMIARLRERASAAALDRIRAEVMDGQALSVADATFDAGVSVLGLMFFPDLGAGMAELRRVVRPGGRVGIVCWGDPQKLQPHTLMMEAIAKAVPGFQPPPTPPVWARLDGLEALNREMHRAGFRDLSVTTSGALIRIDAPGEFWSRFTSSAPPLAYLFERLGPQGKEAVGRAFIELLKDRAGDGVPILTAEAAIGIGRV